MNIDRLHDILGELPSATEVFIEDDWLILIGEKDEEIRIKPSRRPTSAQTVEPQSIVPESLPTTASTLEVCTEAGLKYLPRAVVAVLRRHGMEPLKDREMARSGDRGWNVHLDKTAADQIEKALESSLIDDGGWRVNTTDGYHARQRFGANDSIVLWRKRT